jgi:hypothetical protein
MRYGIFTVMVKKTSSLNFSTAAVYYTIIYFVCRHYGQLYGADAVQDTVPGQINPAAFFRKVVLYSLKTFRGILQSHTDKKENKIFLIYKEIQMGSGAKSFMRKGFLIYEKMHKYFHHL